MIAGDNNVKIKKLQHLDLLTPDSVNCAHERHLPGVELQNLSWKRNEQLRPSSKIHLDAGKNLAHQLDPLVFCLQLSLQQSLSSPIRQQNEMSPDLWRTKQSYLLAQRLRGVTKTRTARPAWMSNETHFKIERESLFKNKKWSPYQDSSSKKPVEKTKTEHELDGTDDHEEGEGHRVNQSLSVD